MSRGLLSLLVVLVASWSSANGQVAATAAEKSPSAPIVRAALDAQKVVPGQAVELSMTVLVPTWLPKPPTFPSLELDNVAVRQPPDSSGPAHERIGNATWSGVRRVYHLYPMVPGRYRIPALTINVVAADPETRKPIVSAVQTEDLIFEVVAPAGAEDLSPFIAASALVLKQRIEPASDDQDGMRVTLEAGDALTRTVIAEISGGPAMAIPSLVPALASSGLAVYPKEPVVEETIEDGAISGSRREQVTYVGESGGKVDVPPIALRWFNTESKQIETARLPGFTIEVDAPFLPPGTDWRDLAPWLALAALLGVVIGLALMRLRPRLAAWRDRRHAIYLASEAYACSRIRKAIRARDLSATLSSMERWSARLPAVAGDEEKQLSAALTRLGAERYGAVATGDSHSAWAALSAAHASARRQRQVAHSARVVANRLPPLNPGGA